MTHAETLHPSDAHRRYRRMVDAHFRGRISRDDERQMRLHLPGCDGCRAHYGRHLRLAAVDPAAAPPARVRLGRGLGLDAERRAARARVRWAMLPAAAVACLALVLWVGHGHRRGDGADGMEARGAGAPSSQLLVYELARPGAVRQVTSVATRGRGLAFAYANAGRKRSLMVFAVDERRRVYWFHPGWNDVSQNPVAIPIQADDAVHEIPQVVYHRFEGQRLQLYGLFVDRALSVREVEAAVARAPLDGGGRLRLGFADAQVTHLDVQLEGAP